MLLMTRSFFIVLVVTTVLAAAPVAGAQTVLDLSATGEANVRPDQVSATLTAQASSGNPVTAQNSVNAAMTAALAAAKTVPGVVATTANYSVSQSQPDDAQGPTIFNASEDITLVEPAAGGVPDAGFATLVGKLQRSGLLLENFDGGLSAAASRAAMRAAIADAMGQVKAQAQAVADSLNESVGRTVSVNLNDSMPGPEPMAPRAMMMAKATAPVAAPANVSVTASVTARVELVAK
jgi:uncharacterized protein YggE